MNKRRAYSGLILVVLCSLAVPVHAITKFEQDGILFIQVIGALPTADDDDFPDDQGDVPPELSDQADDLDITANTFDVQNQCFNSYQGPTINFNLISANEVWGSNASAYGDVDRVQIGARSASDFGFIRSEVIEVEYDTGNTDSDGDPIIDTVDVPCEDFEAQWNEYEEPGFGRLFILDNTTLTVEAGQAGTEVRLEDGFELTFFSGSTLRVNGRADEPVVFRGEQWPGIDIQSGVTADLDQCVFRQARGNGALRVGGFAKVTINDCEFNGNEGQFGGAISGQAEARLTIEDTTFDGNEAVRGGAVYMAGPTLGFRPRLRNVTFVGNEALRGGGMYIEDDDTASDLQVDLQNVTFVDNLSGRGGGLSVTGGSTRIWNPVVVGNTGRREGGGIRVTGDAEVTLYNPTIAFNEASEGGGIGLTDGSAAVDVRNGIIWGNELRDDDGQGPQVGNLAGGRIEFQRVAMEGGADDGYAGPSPDISDFITGAPQFRSLPDEAGEGGGSAQADWRLASESTVINRGDDALFNNLSDFNNLDRDGASRIFPGEEPAIDPGAHEFPNNPPTLESTNDIKLTTDENADPVRVVLCGSYSDADIQPDYPNTVQEPWLTRAPGQGEDEEATDPENLVGRGFGELQAYDGGDAGDTIQANSAIGDSSGRAFYAPANRSDDYDVTIECRVRDRLIDAEGETDETLSMSSAEAQRATISVSAGNESPQLQSSPETNATVDRAYESEIRFSDPDTDHAARDLEVNLVNGPDWLGVRRTDDDIAVLEGRPGAEGEYDVEFEVVDPAGGAVTSDFRLEVSPEEPLDPVEAGSDQRAEPDERVRLAAEGPDQAGLTYEWRIEDDAGNEVASQPGQDFGWTAEAGLFTATVSLVDAGEVIDEDSLALTVESGLNGGVDDGEERTAPDSDQEADLDGMSDDGDPGNQQEWESQTENEKAEALADLATTALDEQQQDAVLNEADALLADAAADPPIDEGLADDLAATYGNLAELELTPERQQAVVDGMAALRDQAEADGVAGAGVRSGLVAGTGALLSDGELAPEQRERLLDSVDGDVAGLDGAIAGESGALDPSVAIDAADAYGNLAGAELEDEQRDSVIDSLETLRSRAAEDDAGGRELTAGLVRAASGLLATGDSLSVEQRDRLLAGVADDVANAAGNDQTLDAITTNRVLAALGNAVSAGELGGDQIDMVLAGLDNALAATDSPTAIRLVAAATVAGDLIAEVGPQGLSPEQRDAVDATAREIVVASIRDGEPLDVTGATYLKLASGIAAGGSTDDVVIGPEGGPRAVIPGTAIEELRSRNALAGSDSVGIGLIATLADDMSSYVVEIFATDGDGTELTEQRTEESIRLTIPVTVETSKRPISTGGTAASISSVDEGEQAVAFGTDEFATFTLATDIEPGDERSDSDKASCFLDSLF